MKDEDVARIVATWPDTIVVSKEIRDTKYNTCLSCGSFHPEKKICNICSCEMNLLTWSKYMGTCPLGHFKGS